MQCDNGGFSTCSWFSSFFLMGVTILALSGCSGDAEFPDQPITLICPWSAGGGTDRVSRQVAAQLERELNVPVNVINATGGSGVTGHTRGALARADGYTLTTVTVELNMLHWRGLTTISYRDFAPLTLLNRDSAALFVRQDSPYESLAALEAAIREEPGRLKVSGTAYGGIWHVAMAGWLNARGIDVLAATWISINGAGPSLQELMAGGVDFVCCSLPEADTMLASGQVRSLGVMAESRLPEFPDVRTFQEQSHDWVMAGWRGIAAPKDTPAERLDLLSSALERIANSDELKEFMGNAGFKLSVEGPDEFAATLAEQDEIFHGILKGDAFRQVSEEHFGPLLFPAVIGVLLLLTLAAVVVDVRREGTGAERAAVSLRPAAIVFGAAVFYLLAAESLGFIPTAAIMTGGLFLVFGVRPLAALAIVIPVTAITYHVFAVLLRVPLPRGFMEW